MNEAIVSGAKIFILLFAIIDPFGSVPLFLSMTARDEEKARRKMAAKACVVALLVLTMFAVFGDRILQVFSVDVPAFQVAGGIVLAMTALPMLAATRIGARILPSEEEEGVEKSDISIVPLAIPLLSGPGAITAVIALTQQAPPPAPPILVILCAALVLAVTFLILRASSRIASILGATGLNVLTRISGLIILVVAVQFILEGAKAFFAG
jgi:multiple antibiotic resistance protein